MKLDLLTTVQLAAKYGVTEQRVRQWVADGRLTPALTLPSGAHLFLPKTRRPKPQKRGPKA